MNSIKAPTNQKADARPIAFVLDDNGQIRDPVTLKIRPEDLSRQEPSRVSVHQTLGRKISGWVDNFGLALPTCTIVGHTGWRASGYSAVDGVAAFQALNKLVMHDYHNAKQKAIEDGIDPAGVKLLFVDMLDDFAWSVTPMQFVLRRSKSRPLLMQYNISLQAIATQVDVPVVLLPDQGNTMAGLTRLSAALESLGLLTADMNGAIAAAVAAAGSGMDAVAGYVNGFTSTANAALKEVYSVVSSINQGEVDLANRAIAIARDISTVGINVFRTLSAIRDLPNHLRAEMSRVAAAYNEMLCIFSNALRPKKTYEAFDGLYGASNCSSTTGGRAASQYANSNPFSSMQTGAGTITITSAAGAAITALKSSDPVLAPMAIQEVGRNLNEINSGLSVAT